MRHRPTDLLVFALLLLWGTALFVGLAILQRPFFLPEVSVLVRRVAVVGVALWVGLAALGVGWVLVRALALRAGPADAWLVAALLGLGAVGAFWLLLGMVQVPSPVGTALLLLLPLPALWRWREPLPTLPALSLPLRTLLGLLLGSSFLLALLPAISFDALLYHLRLPELWLAGGTLFQAEKAGPFHFPVLVEALLLPAYQLGGEGAAGVVDWFFFPLLLVLLWRMTRHSLPSVSAPLLLVVAVTIQMVPFLAPRLYTDLPLAAYQIGMVWALLRWREERAGGWLLVAALCAGFATGIKYLSVLTPLMGILFLLWVARRAALPLLLRFAGMALLAGGGSYLRNLLATGNPLFPFGLPSPYWDSFRGAAYAASGSGIGTAWQEWVLVPWHSVLGTRDTSYFDARPGPLLATFAPLGGWFWLRGRGDRVERQVIATLLLFALGYLLLWGIGIASSAALWQGRFLITPLLLLCPVAAWGIGQLESLTSVRFAPAWVARAFVVAWAVVATTIALAEWGRLEPLAPLTGQVTDEAWRAERLPGYWELVEQVRSLPAGSRTLLLIEPRSYGLPASSEGDPLLFAYTWRLWRGGSDAARFGQSLCQEGFSHAAIYWNGVRFLQKEATFNVLSDEQVVALEQWRDAQHSLWWAEGGSHELVQLACAP